MLLLSLSGGFAAAADGREIAIKSRKARALLAYLALSPRMSRSREQVMALLWSDRGEAQARASLRQVLVGLRRDLGAEAAGALTITNDFVALDPGKVTVSAAGGGEELLAGFHLHDPAFEDWLRDERMRAENQPEVAAALAPPDLPDGPSIAVLPFTNLSGDPEQDYFAEGLTEDVIALLARFRSLFVIGSTSSLAYKGQAPTIQDVARDLGVAYVAQGSVRKAGNRVRVSIELIEAASGRQLWAERHDRELEDIFAIQDEIANLVVATLAGQVEDSDRRRAAQKRSEDLAAYELLLLGEQAERAHSKDGILRARVLLRQAIERDPRDARAHASMARTFLDEIWSDWTPSLEAAGRAAFDWAQKAVALDPLDNRARVNLGVAFYHAKGDFEAAQAQFARALELNPNDADAYCLRGWCHVLAGEGDDAIACTDRAMRLSPFEIYDCHVAQFLAHYMARRYADALTALGRIPGPGAQVTAFRAACCAQLGRAGEARQAIDSYLAEAVDELADWPGEDRAAWQRYWASHYPFRDAADMEHLLDGLRKAGLPV